jgi:hypothetical protein
VITSKHIIGICEKWAISLKRDYNNAPFDIFVNPSSSDYSEIYKNDKRDKVRYIANNHTKEIFVWDAFLAIHPDVAKKLGISSNLYSCNDPNIVTGEAKFSGGRATALTAYPTDPKIIKDTLKVNWSWTDRYVGNVKTELQGFDDRRNSYR